MNIIKTGGLTATFGVCMMLVGCTTEHLTGTYSTSNVPVVHSQSESNQAISNNSSNGTNSITSSVITVNTTTVTPIKKPVPKQKTIPNPAPYDVFWGHGSPQIYAVPPGDVAITIDDGPSPYTESILNTLKTYHVKATMFFIGENTLHFPNAVKDAVTQGEVIGDHTYNHPIMTNLSLSDQWWEINTAYEDIQKFDPNPISLYRPPYGAINQLTYEVLMDHKMTEVLWNRDPRDWAATTPQQIVDAVVNGNPSGAVFDLHDKKLTAEALPTILKDLQAKGLHFVTIESPKGWNGTIAKVPPLTPTKMPQASTNTSNTTSGASVSNATSNATSNVTSNTVSNTVSNTATTNKTSNHASTGHSDVSSNQTTNSSNPTPNNETATSNAVNHSTTNSSIPVVTNTTNSSFH